MKTIIIYDTTLRDGTQAEDIAFTIEDKLRIAERLDDFGIQYVEGGWPGSNPRDGEFFERAKRELRLKNAKLTAFGSTHRSGVKVEDDQNLMALIMAETPVVTIFGKTWVKHVTDDLRIHPDANLALIYESVKFLKSRVQEVVFDAEHFFQGWLRDGGVYQLAVLDAAVAGGANTVALCDTNGIAYPWQVFEVVSTVVARFGDRVTVGVHMHDDRGQAVANSIEAVRAGARHVQGTTNGYSERVSMACTLEVVANLQLLANEGYAWAQINPDFNAEMLTQLSREADRWAGLPIHLRKPFVGRYAAAHKAGVHGSAISRGGARLYESHNPEQFGRRRYVVVSSMAGRANVVSFVNSTWNVVIDGNDGLVTRLLEEVERRESQYGYCFDSASGSAALLAAKILWPNAPTFEPLAEPSFSSSFPGARSGELMATILMPDHRLASGSGDGPVDASFKALIGELSREHSCLRQLTLDTFRTFQLRRFELEGTESAMRVEIDWQHELYGDFTTQGVSGNLISASFDAILEAVNLVLVYQWRAQQTQNPIISEVFQTAQVASS